MHIVFTGPESCGKTTLASWTSLRYNLPLIPEMARFYLEGRSSYDTHDLSEILKLQLTEERKWSSNNWLISDTDALTIEIWEKYKFGTSFTGLINRNDLTKTKRYYFLCDKDVPWQYDPLREHPNERHLIFQVYLEYLHKYELPFTLLSGSLQVRQQSIISKLEDLGLLESAS